jgi:hypothetical protein
MGCYNRRHRSDTDDSNYAVNAHTYRIAVPLEKDDSFNMDVAILDIIVVGMSAKLKSYDVDANEYYVVIDDKQYTILALKGYKISHRFD